MKTAAAIMNRMSEAGRGASSFLPFAFQSESAKFDGRAVQYSLGKKEDMIMEMDKMKRNAGTLELLLNITEKLMWLGGLLMIAIFAAAFFLRDQIPSYITNININGIPVTLEAMGGTAAASRYIVASAAMALVDIIIAIIGIRAGRNALKTVKEGRPFDESVSANLKKIGWIVLICTILFPLIKAGIDAALLGKVDFSQILNTGAAGKTHMRLNISLTNVFFALVLFLLSHIFSYGAALEKKAAQK